MDLYDFQVMRNQKARQLRSVTDIEERRRAAYQLGRELTELSSKLGFITQNYYWITYHAGLKSNEQLRLF